MSKKSDLAVNFKSATVYLVRLVLDSHDTAELLHGINTHIEKSGNFFENEPVVLDAQNLKHAPDWQEIVNCLSTHSIPVMGFTAQDTLIESGQKAGLIPLNLAPTHTKTTNSTTAVDVIVEAQPATQNTSVSTLIIDKPLRSGQKIYARNSDLIVMGLVSQGAEILADGNIHVYGPLRGKAMAGATGDTHAKIFATQFDAELVSIAGTYRALNPVPPSVQNKPTQVFLDGEKLIIDNLAI